VNPRRRLLELALLAAGLALLGWIFTSAGWPAIAANLSAIGGWFVALTAFYVWAEVAFVAAWWLVCEPRPPLSFFPRLLGVYLEGNTANYVSPGNVAGEPLKIGLLADRLGGPGAAASITLHTHAHLLGQTLFVALGVAVALARHPVPTAVRVAGIAGALLLVFFLALMTFALRKGAFGPILGRLSLLRPLARRLERFQDGAADVDAAIRGFHERHRGRFLAAAALCFVGFCGGLVETWIVLRLLAPGRGLADAVALETLAMSLNNMLLFIPGRIGGAEGVRTGLAMLLGATKAQGAAYSVVRRARELVWVLFGLLLLLHRQARRLAVAEARG
jgi:hypothetical protein